LHQRFCLAEIMRKDICTGFYQLQSFVRIHLENVVLVGIYAKRDCACFFSILISTKPSPTTSKLLPCKSNRLRISLMTISFEKSLYSRNAPKMPPSKYFGHPSTLLQCLTNSISVPLARYILTLLFFKAFKKSSEPSIITLYLFILPS